MYAAQECVYFTDSQLQQTTLKPKPTSGRQNNTFASTNGKFITQIELLTTRDLIVRRYSTTFMARLNHRKRNIFRTCTRSHYTYAIFSIRLECAFLSTGKIIGAGVITNATAVTTRTSQPATATVQLADKSKPLRKKITYMHTDS